MYGNLTLPRCDDGTRLSFPLPAQLTTAPARELAGGQVVPETLAVPDYYEDEWWRDLKAGALSRVVRVSFPSPCQHIQLQLRNAVLGLAESCADSATHDQVAT